MDILLLKLTIHIAQFIFQSMSSCIIEKYYICIELAQNIEKSTLCSAVNLKKYIFLSCNDVSFDYQVKKTSG